MRIGLPLTSLAGATNVCQRLEGAFANSGGLAASNVTCRRVAWGVLLLVGRTFPCATVAGVAGLLVSFAERCGLRSVE